ncbi:hypothetical protein [Prescottella sp. R16]|uniref:hypothetical protein n=1 Tax=Prescottella sp. R16 TaxID=3064529 RepID=UPI00272E3B1D|nr:hypothetical protein [Prescottella sp. R16]
MSGDDPDGPEPEPTGPGDDRAEPEYFAGEHGRRVPRAAWLVLGAALVLLLGFVVVRPSWFTRDVDDTSLHVPPERHFTKTLAGSGHPDGVWLTDDNPTTSYLVTLPADSTPSRTRLHLLGSTRVAVDSTVFLTVSMDGQQVYTNRLDTGDNALDTFVDVPGQAAADGRVRIQVRVDGTRHDEVCTPDHSAGMQVHLTPDTVVEAALDEPIHTVRDAVASWDRDVTIVLADLADEWRTTAAQAGMALTRAGHDIRFTDRLPETDMGSTVLVGPADTLTTSTGWSADDTGDGVVVGRAGDTPVTAIVTPQGHLLATYLTEATVATADTATADPRSVTPAVPAGDQVSFDALGVDTSVGRITETRQWRVRYSLADLPGGRLPDAARVVITLPASPDDLTWILNADLNGRFVGSQRLNPTAGTVTVPLPAENQLLENTLTLTIERDRDLGGCDVRVTDYPIQLQGESALLLGDAPGAGFTATERLLAPGFAVYVPDASPQDAIAQLDATVPALTGFVPAHYDPPFLWGTAPRPGQPFVAIGASPDVHPSVQIRDGRIVAGATGDTLDIPSFDDGLVVATATESGGGVGIVLQYAGAPGEIRLPAFGFESAQVVTSQGSIAVAADGTIPATTPVRRIVPR